jgi:hypothetical protein
MGCGDMGKRLGKPSKKGTAAMAKKVTAAKVRARAPSHVEALTFENILSRQPHEPAPWVCDMQRHYAEHGFYRAGDLDRLLGQPGDSISGSTIFDFVRNGTSSKK